MEEYMLSQNYPDPFNPETTISYDVPDGPDSLQKVDLTIYDSRGRLVRTLVSSNLPPGFHRVVWDGRDNLGKRVASGIFFSVLQVGYRTSTRKMIVLR